MQTITIICKASSNPISEITGLLADQQINIEGFDFNQFGEDASLLISVSDSDYDKSFSLLTEKGYSAVSDDVVLIRADNKPGELAGIARTLTEADVTVRSLALMDAHSEFGIVAVTTNKNDSVREIFAGQLVN